MLDVLEKGELPEVTRTTSGRPLTNKMGLRHRVLPWALCVGPVTLTSLAGVVDDVRGSLGAYTIDKVASLKARPGPHRA